ncbi:hypothetical protein NHX12_010863 [Muraenolepis orangiensis]|uniref:Peroxisome proliferator-activated receptor gamma coactivator 1-beta n=1 Tax=Muraenolepis orangiensis TaxID=630683 RepID=A0A9Q0DER5_9TELE|nr:hypothetical protein NHX12_010863 [Muraenolepis orangiensis]
MKCPCDESEGRGDGRDEDGRDEERLFSPLLVAEVQYGEEEVYSDRLDSDFPDIDLSQLDASDFNCLSELHWCSDQTTGGSPASVHYSTEVDELFEIEEENAALLAALTDSLDSMVDAEVGGLSVFPALGEGPSRQEEEDDDNLSLSTGDFGQSAGTDTEDPSLLKKLLLSPPNVPTGVDTHRDGGHGHRHSNRGLLPRTMRTQVKVSGACLKHQVGYSRPERSQPPYPSWYSPAGQLSGNSCLRQGSLLSVSCWSVKAFDPQAEALLSSEKELHSVVELIRYMHTYCLPARKQHAWGDRKDREAQAPIRSRASRPPTPLLPAAGAEGGLAPPGAPGAQHLLRPRKSCCSHEKRACLCLPLHPKTTGESQFSSKSFEQTLAVDLCGTAGLTPPTTPPHKPVEDEIFKPHQRKLPEQTELYAQLRGPDGGPDGGGGDGGEGREGGGIPGVHHTFGDHDYCALSLGESRKRSAALLGAILRARDGRRSHAATPPASEEEEGERSSSSRSPSPALDSAPGSPTSKMDSSEVSDSCTADRQRNKAKPDEDNCQVLYIHNLPSAVTHNMLRKRFQVFGSAQDCKRALWDEAGPGPIKSKYDALDFDTLLKEAQKSLHR